jgi:hypothetical protein
MRLGFGFDLERWVIHLMVEYEDGESECLQNLSFDNFATMGTDFSDQVLLTSRMAATAVQMRNGECTLDEIDAVLRRMQGGE